MHTIASLLSKHTQLNGSDSSRLDCELLLSEVLCKDRAYLYAWPERFLSDEQSKQFFVLFERRQQGEPIAYILGRQEFWSLPLQVNTSTLIPRPATETLVETALERFAARRESQLSVLDLGTGTGAIALALASECLRWQVTAVDKQADAIALAKQNASNLGVKNVVFFCSDWYEKLNGQVFNAILANPPYIDAKDPHLQQGDVRFEPKTALVADKQGMADLEHIITLAPQYLLPGGYLLLEHGFQQGEAVRALLSARGFQQVQTRADLSGLARVSCGCISR